MKVQGPNGVVVDVRPAVATGLVGNGKRGYAFVSDTDTNASGQTSEARSRRGRKTKTTTPPDESESGSDG